MDRDEVFIDSATDDGLVNIEITGQGSIRCAPVGAVQLEAGDEKIVLAFQCKNTLMGLYLACSADAGKRLAMHILSVAEHAERGAAVVQ